MKTYTAPQCNEKGDIASLTQADKTWGAGDGILFDIDGNIIGEIRDYS